MDDRINVNQDDGILEIPIDELNGFQLQNVSQGRVSIESELRQEIGIEENGEVMVTELGEGFALVKSITQEKLDEMAKQDLLGEQ